MTIDMGPVVERLDALIALAERQAFSPVAPHVAHATREDRATKRRDRVVEAAKTPRDYVLEYLAQHPADLAAAGGELNYRDLAERVSATYGMDFDHTTVFRAVKAARKKGNK